MTSVNDVLLFTLIYFVIFIMLRLFKIFFLNYRYRKFVIRSAYKIPKIVIRLS